MHMQLLLEVDLTFRINQSDSILLIRFKRKQTYWKLLKIKKPKKFNRPSLSYTFYQQNFIMKPNNFKNAQTHYEFVLGPIKIKDGLFMGDQLAAKDIQFIISNKVTHVINTVSKVIPNLWQRFGIQYLSVNWTEKQQNIFDKKNNAINAIFDFIEEAMQQGQSCLIHSLHGKSRACAVMVAYMMKKYHWTLDRCFEYITSKKEHLEIRDNYLSQLQQLEKRMMAMYTLSGNWKDCRNDEQVLLRNTYFNAKIVQVALKQPPKSTKKRIEWGQVAVIQNKPTNYNNTSSAMSSTMNRFKDSKEKRPSQGKRLKSILKGCENPVQDYEDPKMEQKLVATDSFANNKKDNNFISTINGNIVHVTVNNFITTDKKAQKQKSHLTRPYSSDNKQRLQNQIRGPKIQPKKNLFYDTSFKSPYDTKLATKLATSNSKITKKKEELKNPIVSYGRPQSANISGERGKMNRVGVGLLDSSGRKDELMVAGKKRYPSTNPREELYRFK